MAMNVVALAGGVGGAKMADGLAQVLPAVQLTVVVNTGDDFEHLGLHISPDLDTVCYTLAGLANRATGWGRADESWHFLETLEALGGPAWFQLGDRDLALHHERTRRLALGESLSSVTRGLSERMGVRPRVLPMSDDRVRTLVQTDAGELPFQTYFVEQACAPAVRGFRFDGVAAARPAPGVLAAIASAEAVILCPSNPWVSLDPILAVPGMRPALAGKAVVGVSPIVRGQALKGPAAKMARELGVEASPVAIAEHFGGLLTGLVIDVQDAAEAGRVQQTGARVRAANTVMKSPAGRRALAAEVLEFTRQLAG
jgi:LPPG:FO 2-phospho-L-lactate transferase